MKKRQVIVVGGGASGMVAAITAAREGAEVTIIEHKSQLGKKILSTGNGKCNLTNTVMTTDCFRGENLSIVEQVLQQFGYRETLDFFEAVGLLVRNRRGYIYPLSEQASAVVDVLVMELEKCGVQILLEEHVTGITKEATLFCVTTEKGTRYADAVILATGGKAASVLGSDGSGYTLAKQLGHKISSVVPALVQLRGKGTYFKQIAGVRVNAKVSVFVDGVCLSHDSGELQLTNYGISGIPVFQISRFAAKALLDKKTVSVEIDFFPEMEEDAFREFIRVREKKYPERTAADFFVGIFHRKLAEFFLKQSYIPVHIKASEIREDKWEKLVMLCKHFQVEIEDTNSFEQAQICAGGVLTDEICPTTMESKLVKGFYITGEVMDIDGICGGYNLQWAWATGYLAGKHAAKGTES